MFTFQAVVRKRGRDYDSDSEDEHYIKKSRSDCGFSKSYSIRPLTPLSILPYPISISPSPPRLPTEIEVLTPAQSPLEDVNSPAFPGRDFPEQQSQSSYVDYSMDVDDDDADVRSQPPCSPALGSMSGAFMRPAMLNSSLFTADAASNSARIPTPMHPTFRRGGMNGLGYPSTGFAGGLNDTSYGTSHPIVRQFARPGRQLDDDDRNRRAPSPITEDEDLPDTPTMLTQSQLSRLSFSHPSAEQMEMDMSTQGLTVPLTPRGRKRSGALTGVGRFSMGYRDDCEKCRQRVPGHYSHFVT